MSLRDVLKLLVPPAAVLRWRRPPSIPDRDLYRPLLRYEPLFSPWFADGAFGSAFERAAGLTMLDRERAWILWSMALQSAQLPGDFVEAGVYRGGSALITMEAIRTAEIEHDLHLFDSFEGLPAPGGRDLHASGDLADTSLDQVRSLFDGEPRVVFHAGWIPDTFEGSAIGRVAFAHVDLDLERSLLDACEFLYPRLVPGGALVFDDYGFSSCPGARAAVDQFFASRPETPLVLPTGQAVVVRLPS